MQTSNAGRQWSKPRGPSLIDWQVDGAIATITLRNPARRNAMTQAMWRALRETIDSVNNYQNNSLKPNEILRQQPILCIILKGEGAHFCAGGDISEYPKFRFHHDSLRAFHEEDVAPALHALLSCDVPLVAQIEGHCLGGGLEIAACCDIRIAGQGATFGAPIAKLGMPMAPQELAILLRTAGEATVREMLLEAAILNAQQMAQRGFVQRVVGDSQVAEQALASAQRIAMLGPQAARLNKQTLRHFYQENNLSPHLNTSFLAIDNIASSALMSSAYAYASSDEHVEGIGAFLAKRSPQF
jgi:enoyl-CoA hydratase